MFIIKNILKRTLIISSRCYWSNSKKNSIFKLNHLPRKGIIIMKDYVLVIDEGTTGTRALIFDRDFNILDESYEEFTQYTPRDNMVEHDPVEIYEKSVKMCKQVLKKTNISPEEIETIGITNQRATCLLWDKETGEPLHRAIVWQDTRAAAYCEQLKADGWAEKAKKATGIEVTPAYSSLMVKWIMDNVEGVKEKVKNGEVLYGTIETWLVWKLTGGAVHASSYSNASASGSLDLRTNYWYKELLDYLEVPVSIHPQVVNDSGNYGNTDENIFGTSIPITGVIADQHAALYAQDCRKSGTAKVTNGTGSFLDINIGSDYVISKAGLNTLIAWKTEDEIFYAMEGFAGTTGAAIQWLRDKLGIIESSQETEKLAFSVDNTNGVYFVPALSGLNAPYWDSSARGTIIGISRGSDKAHIARATLESIAFRMKDIFDAVEEEALIEIDKVRIDGGASQNNFLAQRFADMLDAIVERPGSMEATSLGAAQMAGLYTGFWDKEDFDKIKAVDSTFTSQLDAVDREREYKIWKRAIDRAAKWLDFDF